MGGGVIEHKMCILFCVYNKHTNALFWSFINPLTPNDW
jgi:hypothetical protein